jgi:sphingolipid C9-methyltransferase
MTAWDKLTDNVKYPTINNAPLPADAGSNDSFNNTLLFSILLLVPTWFSWKVGGGLYTTIFFSLFTTLPILIVFWTVASRVAPRKNEKARYPGKGVEYYLNFHKESDRFKYHGKSKIPMETFHEMYFRGEVDFKGDALEAMEYRHDWANFNFTPSLFKFFLTGMLPEVIMHTRSQGGWRAISTLPSHSLPF